MLTEVRRMFEERHLPCIYNVTIFVRNQFSIADKQRLKRRKCVI